MKKIVNSRIAKILSFTLAVLLVTAGVATVVFASTGSVDQSVSDETSSIEESIENTIHLKTDPESYDKEETVYVIADANGQAEEVIVSDWLKNPQSIDELEDYTELNDIINTNGNETFSNNGRHRYVWHSQGKDIHYQGDTTKQLPVSVSVSYQLDGNEISPEELSGKSGHVTIRFSYTNTQKASVMINGKPEEICVPFLMVSGLILENQSFFNVKVTNGSVYNDGSRNIVIGYALPELSNSLSISKEDFNIPEYVEIEADTTDFSLSTTLTVGITNIFDNIDIDSENSINDVADSIDELEEATLKIIDGSSDLYSGTSEFYNSCDDVVNGVNYLLSGAKELNNGADKVNTGAGNIRDGLDTLSKNSTPLKTGAKKMVDSVFSTATEQLRLNLVSSGLMAPTDAANITLTPSSYVSVFQQLSGAVAVLPEQVEAQLRSALPAMSADQQSLTLTIAYDLMIVDSNLSYTDAVTRAAGFMADAGTSQTACGVIDSTWLSDAAHQTLIAQVMSAISTDADTAAKISAIALTLDPVNPAAKITDAASILSHASTVMATTTDVSKIAALCTSVASAATSTGNASLDAVKTVLYYTLG